MLHPDTPENATSVTLNPLRWSSLGTHGHPSCPDKKGSIRQICTEGRECPQPPHQQSHIDDVRTARAKCFLPEGSMCAVKSSLVTRMASMYSATGKILVRSSRGDDCISGDVHSFPHASDSISRLQNFNKSGDSATFSGNTFL